MTKHIECKRPNSPKTIKQLQGDAHTKKQKITPWGGWVPHSAHNKLHTINFANKILTHKLYSNFIYYFNFPNFQPYMKSNIF
jgi:hypothetical protein